MPNVSLEKNLLRITLTQAEAASYGFHSNQSQLIRKKKEPSGDLVLEISSINSTAPSAEREITVWIPPALISFVSPACPAPSIKKLGGSAVSSKLEGEMRDWEKPSEPSIGQYPQTVKELFAQK